jgi:putative peptidoglycan lipid II flippase
MVLAVASNIIGFFREMIIAAHFGTRNELGVFVLSQQVPLIIYNAVLLSLPGIIIPLYYRWSSEPDFEERLWELSRLWLWVSIGITIVMFLSAPWIFDMLSSLEDPAIISLGHKYFRISSLMIVFGGIFGIFRSLANARKSFVLPSVMMIVGNVLVVLLIYSTASLLGIDSLLYSVLAGIIVQTLLLVFFVSPKKEFFIGGIAKSVNPKEIVLLAMPLLMLEFLFALNNAVDYALASNHSGEVIASLNYAMILFRIPTIVVGMSLGTTLLARLSENVITKNIQEFKNASTRSMTLGLFFLIPLSALVFLFSEDIVRLSFHRGAFNEESVLLTAGFLRQLTPSIALVTVYYFFSKAITALDLNKKMVLVFCIVIILKICVYYILQPMAGMTALMIAINVSFLALIAGLILIVHQKVSGILTINELIFAVKLIVVCSLSIAVAMSTNKYYGTMLMTGGMLLFKREREYVASKVRSAADRLRHIKS